jgi:hypothetical protein
MTDHVCACGFEAISDDELADHVGDLMIPDDDIAPDGARHAEAAGPGGHQCLCGFRADSGAALDEHLLAVFTVFGAVGRDGRGHGG